ncbi:hypothetical protein L0156_25355, partial [bacterium]|nr:hypothetical protein [bacterium]
LHCFLKNQSHQRFLVITILIFASAETLSITYFPLHPGRSDMLPLIQAAGYRFLSGGNPYSTYSLPHSVPLTYLPGMWMAYIPAVLMHFDLRFIHAAAIVFSVLIIYWGTESSRKSIVAGLGGIFLLTPYLLYRHEIYIGILWVPLALFLLFQQKNRPIWSSAWLGIAAGVSQFAWILVPLSVTNIYRRFGIKIAAQGSVCFLAVFLAILIPFAVQTPKEFYSGVFAHWENTFNATTLNFSYFATKVVPGESLKYVQVIGVLAICFLANKTKNLSTYVYEFLTYTLLFFVLLNPLIWVYFYLSLFVLMIMDATQASVEST